MLKIGFTGTQWGMTANQQHQLAINLRVIPVDEFHHGDCIGADCQAHAIAWQKLIPIVIHPPSDSKKRAFCYPFADRKMPKPYLERNHDIVDECDELIAAPGEMEEVLRSGTWATIRYAKKVGTPITILQIDGTFKLC